MKLNYFGIRNQFSYIKGETNTGGVFFVVHAENAIAFELHMHNIIHSRGDREELIEVKNPLLSQNNRFYELRILSNK